MDPDAISRTDRGDTTTGDAVGTKQSSEFKVHTHVHYTTGVIVAGFPISNLANASLGSSTTTANAGSETRPINIYLIPLIQHL